MGCSRWFICICISHNSISKTRSPGLFKLCCTLKYFKESLRNTGRTLDFFITFPLFRFVIHRITLSAYYSSSVSLMFSAYFTTTKIIHESRYITYFSTILVMYMLMYQGAVNSLILVRWLQHYLLNI